MPPRKKSQQPAAAQETPAAAKEQDAMPDINETTKPMDVQPAAAQETPAVEQAETPAAPAAPEPPKTKRVMFMSTPGVDGAKNVDVFVNDRFYNFRRDVPVDVPVHVLEVLDHAVMTLYERKGNDMIPKEVKRFPYQFVID